MANNKIRFCFLGLLFAISELRGDSLLLQGPEIFPIDPRIDQLKSADFDGDGLEDLLVVNGRRSRLQILYNQSANEEARAPIQNEINQLPPDARFRIEPISVEERVSSVVVADLIGDAKPDIAYCGNLNEIILLENRGSRGWLSAARWTFSDVLPGPHSLRLGDLNGDGFSELLVLTASWLFQIPILDMQNARPKRVPLAGEVESSLVSDFSGDGIDDVLFLPKSNSKFAFLRLGSKSGPSASEYVIELGESRHTSLIKAEAGLLTIARRTGRARLGTIQKSTNAIGEGALVRIPIPKSASGSVESFSADLNADGLMDLIAADGESGKLLVYLQSHHGRYALPREFGSFAGIGQIRCADWDADGFVNIFLLSYAEKQVGLCQWNDKQGIAFPTSIDLDGTPMGIGIGNFGGQRLIILEKTKAKLQLRIVDSNLKVKRHWVDLELNANRVDLRFHDVDQDGLEDIIVLAPYEDLWVLRQMPDEAGFEPIRLPSAMRDMERTWIGAVDFDGDGAKELVIPQRNAVRGIVLEMHKEQSARVRIKAQINGSETDSIIGGLVELDEFVKHQLIKTNEPASLIVALLDVKSNEITCMRQKGDGQWEPLISLPLPPGDYHSLDETILDFGDHHALRITASGRTLIQVLGGNRWEFSTRGTYETQLKGGYLGKAISGDLDEDALTETLFLETAKHHIEMVSWDSESRSRLLYRWPVFETRTFRNRRNELPEPREAMLKDLTGDGRTDLVLIVHDRVLLYPQQ